MSAAPAMAPCTIMVIVPPEFVRLMHDRPQFADTFLAHMPKRNIRIGEDQIGQLFNSTETTCLCALADGAVR
jgi:hypothetical protein